MSVSVLVPWRPGCPHREAAWAWVQERYRIHHAGWQIIEGTSPDGPFSRTAAILDAARRADGDVLVVADSDVWCDEIALAVTATTCGWMIPHELVHRLSPDSTLQVLHGDDWRGLPLSTDNRQDSRPYRGHATGTLVVLTRDAFNEAPPDPRFAGWGSEDDAWACALRTLVGRPWRGDADLVHLWHPAQPRKNRRVGNDANLELYRRYRLAERKPARMRALLDETRFPAETTGR